MSNALVILLGSSTYVLGMILGENAWQSLFVLDLEVWERPFNRFLIFLNYENKYIHDLDKVHIS